MIFYSHNKKSTNRALSKMKSSAGSFPFLNAAIISLSAIFAVIAPATDAQAKPRHHTPKQSQKHNKERAANAGNPAGTSIVIDAETGKEIIPCDQCDTPRPPASMTKIVTAMVVFDAIRAGKFNYDTVLTLVASPDEDREAAVGLHRNYHFPVGAPLTVDSLISATAVTSAADATMTLSNAICGTDDCIAALMNKKLDSILPPGHITHYANAHGMPDPRQITTAREQALILKYMVDNYPQEYRYFGQSGYNIGKKYMKGHNRLLVDYNTRSKFDPYSCLMEGGKTGFFRAAGSNIVGSAVCDGHRVIAVKMGARSAGSRDSEIVGLFDRGFKALKGTPVTVPGSLKPHRPGILRPTPDLEIEPDNENQPEKVSNIPTDTHLARNFPEPAKISPAALVR